MKSLSHKILRPAACFTLALLVYGCDKKSNDTDDSSESDPAAAITPVSSGQPADGSGSTSGVVPLPEIIDDGQQQTGAGDVDSDVPLAPSSFVYSLLAPSFSESPELSWAASLSPDAHSYLVSLGTTPGGQDLVNKMNVGNTLSYQFESQNFLECEQLYPSLQAIDQSGNLSEIVFGEHGFVYDSADPLAPVGPVVSGGATVTSSKLLSWTAGSDNCPGLSYELSVGTAAGDSDAIAWTNGGESLSHQFSGVTLQSDQDYFTNIRAVDISGRKSALISSSAWRLPGVPDAVTGLSVAGRKKDEIEFSWSIPFANGSDIIDYLIEYKLSSADDWISYDDGISSDTNVKVSGLVHSSSYDVRIKTYNGSLSSWSAVISAETLVDDPFFDSEVYTAMNLGGATASAVVAHEDETEVKLNDTVIGTIDAGETLSFVSTLNDKLEANNPIFVAGRNGTAGGAAQDKGNIVWSTPDWAAKDFLFNINRSAPAIVTIYAFEESTVVIYDGGVEVESQLVLEGANHTFSLPNIGSYEMNSTGLIMGYYHAAAGGKIYDPRPILPKSKDIIGFPSSTMDLTSGTDANSYVFTHSNSSSGSGSLTAGISQSLGPQGTSSIYQSEALRIVADQDVIGASYADSNGYCSAPFLPVGMMRKKYAINVGADFVAFASVEAGTIEMIEPDGTTSTLTLARSGADAEAPYKVRVGTTLAGTRFQASVRVGAWYQPNSDTDGGDQDETVLFGVD